MEQNELYAWIGLSVLISAFIIRFSSFNLLTKIVAIPLVWGVAYFMFENTG